MSSRIPRTNSSHEEMEINEPSIPIPQAIYTAQIMLHYPPMPHHMLYHQQQQQQQHLQQQNHHLHHHQQQQHHHIHQQQHLQHQQQLQHQQHHQQQLHHQQLQQHQQMIHHLQQSQQLPTASLPALITPTTTPTASGSNPSEDSGDGGGQVIATSVSNDDGEDVGGDQNHLGRNGDHDPYKSSSYHTDSMKPTHRCTQLTLQQKVEVLQMIDQKIPYREIAKQYNIAHSTISGIKKTKQEIYSLVQKRANLSMHRIHKSMPITSKILDERMYAWYVSNRNQNVLINGRQLQQKALEIAKELSLPDFKASNGWLDSFKRRHQILLKHHTDL